MSSKKNIDGDVWNVDFSRDVPITSADSEPLWEARKLPRLSDEQYMEWVALIEKHHPRERDDSPPFIEPFEL